MNGGPSNPQSAIRNPQSIFLAGATATGKSDVALLLAEKLNGEIISVDSMQVYRGLDIGTAKPTVAERQRVPHHLIDVVDLNEAFDAAQFVRLATKAAQEIHSRGRVAIFCGGTGLYFKAFLEGLGEAPPADPAVRAEIAATPLPELLEELQRRDPVTFDKIDQKNTRRVIRALEVIRLTGKPFSEQRATWSAQPSTTNQPPSTVHVLRRSTADLHRRINQRVDQMFQRGLVEEVKTLLPCGLEENRTAMQAIGYRQVVEHLHGERPLQETIELVKIRTRQFAKRQMTWFRRQLPVKWIDCGTDENAKSTIAKLMTD
jgi:tRNA dimethylallyltransferase